MGRVIPVADAEAIKAAMVQAVEGPLGRQFTTGAKVPGVTTAGKSGTAELGGSGEPHSWFIGFAPAENPTVAIAVLVEQAGRGGEVAAPIAGRLMTRYLQGSAMTDEDDRGAAGSRADVPREPRPLIERIGLAAIALVLATLFGAVAVASWFGGEVFLAAMGAHRLPDDPVGRGTDAPPGLSPAGSLACHRPGRSACSRSANTRLIRRPDRLAMQGSRGAGRS